MGRERVLFTGRTQNDYNCNSVRSRRWSWCVMGRVWASGWSRRGRWVHTLTAYKYVIKYVCIL